MLRTSAGQIVTANLCDQFESVKHYVEIVAWAEDINGDIWSQNLFTVILPSKKDR